MPFCQWPREQKEMTPLVPLSVSSERTMQEALGKEERPTYPCLINGVVKFGFHGDLAVGVGVHQGQAEVGVIATSGEEKRKERSYFCQTTRRLAIPKGNGRRHSLSTAPPQTTRRMWGKSLLKVRLWAGESCNQAEIIIAPNF